MPQSLTIIIVDKTATLKNLCVKDYKTEELYKKCGFKKSEDFELQHEWPVKLEGQKYIIQMYGKKEGKANMENKYDFPPPVDKELYFGACALVGMIRDDTNNRSYINLSLELWNKIYEKLFGGFEDLNATYEDDENEIDELENVKPSMKTKKGGYLKDGFVVDSDESDHYDDGDDDGDDEESEGYIVPTDEDEADDNDDIYEDVGSELSEESYV